MDTNLFSNKKRWNIAIFKEENREIIICNIYLYKIFSEKMNLNNSWNKNRFF